MRRLIILLGLLASPLSHALIDGPTTSTGQFTLTHAFTLEELNASGAVIANYGPGPSTSFNRTDGTYYFREWFCTTIPFGGFACWAPDSHTVTVSGSGGGSQYPEPLEVQSQYTFQIRSGDYDNDGRTDVYVRRMTSGPLDGSMRSYILWNDGNGQVSYTAPGAYLATANASPINTTLNLMPTDWNVDGYADHMIENLDAVMGNGVGEEYTVIAPGIQPNKAMPAGGTAIDQNFKSFYGDLAAWMTKPSYFGENIMTTTIPVYAVGYVCTFITPGWQDNISGFLPLSFCYPYIYVVGFQTVQYGVNFSALSASTYANNVFIGGGPVADSDLWQISQIIYNILGVHAFGFDENGTKHQTNHDETNSEELKKKQMRDWVASIAWYYYGPGGPPDPLILGLPHDYKVETPICSTSQSWCTLANIACWARHYHAPRDDGDFSEPAEHGDIVDLEGYISPNPIRVGVGAAAGLPPNAIGNVTQPGHILHDIDGPGWPTCPKPVPNQGDGTPPGYSECSQVYREPDIESGQVIMRTRGTGDNPFGGPNQWEGPDIFKDLDEAMKQAILNTPGRMCPSL